MSINSAPFVDKDTELWLIGGRSSFTKGYQMPIELIIPSKGTEPVAMRFGTTIITRKDIDNHLARADSPMLHAFILAALECEFITKDAIKKRHPSIINHCVAVWKMSPDIQRIISTAREGVLPSTSVVREESPLEEERKASRQKTERLFRYGKWSLDVQKNHLYFLTASKAIQNAQHKKVLVLLFGKPECIISTKRIYTALTGRVYSHDCQRVVSRIVHEINAFMQSFIGGNPPIAVHHDGYMLMHG